MSYTVYRDRWGIPHLRADSVSDLAFAQGRNAATDRAWQIQVERWRGEGRLAEHLGADEIGWDRFARRALLADTARRCFDNLDEPTRRWIGSYVDGVNSGLAAGTAAAPEFAAIGGTTAQPWEPWHPLSVFLVRHILFGTFPHKLWRSHVESTLGAAAADLFPIEGPVSSGSNAWARPFEIAGDPHRIIELPGVYQQVRLACDEFDVVGLAFPGVPGIAHFGHAGTVAWAVTNAMADYQDLYREELRRVDGVVEARGPHGWEPTASRAEKILVRDGDPVPVEIVETARGPIIDTPSRSVAEGGDGLISLRYPAMVDGDLGFGALLPLLRARTASDVARALRGWVEPVNSVLVADSTGTVLQLVAGRVPLRDARCGEVPVPAWESRYHWRSGYAETPCFSVAGTAVTANDRRPDVADLGNDFAPPHRARRIAKLLASGAPAHAVHMDLALGGQTLRDLLADLAPDGAAARLRERLLAWDGHMRADSADAGAYAAWRTALARRLHADPALAPLRAPSGYDELFAPWTGSLARVGLSLDALVSGWSSLGGGDLRTIAVRALEDVDSPGTWGRRHVLYPVRLDVGVPVPPMAVRLSGDSDCVLATYSVPGVSDACWRGPVARYVWNLRNRAESRWVVPFGASGIPGDPHFADQLPLWTRGDLVPVETDWSRLTPVA
jgi:penicillin amidase